MNPKRENKPFDNGLALAFIIGMQILIFLVVSFVAKNTQTTKELQYKLFTEINEYSNPTQTIVEVTPTVEPSCYQVELLNCRVTAYCPCEKCCGKWSGGNTSSGTTPQQNRTIAVDPSVIPYGTEVTIDGQVYIAEDTGSSIKGNRIDIYFDNHQDALNYGVRYLNVYYWEEK